MEARGKNGSDTSQSKCGETVRGVNRVPPHPKGEDQAVLSHIQVDHQKPVYQHNTISHLIPAGDCLQSTPTEMVMRMVLTTSNHPPLRKTPSLNKPNPAPVKTRGTFTTESHTLRKKYTNRKYICRMCPHRSDSARALTAHHRDKHGIVYCKVCRRAFNNPISLRRHGILPPGKEIQVQFLL